MLRLHVSCGVGSVWGFLQELLFPATDQLETLNCPVDPTFHDVTMVMMLYTGGKKKFFHFVYESLGSRVTLP